MKPNGMTAAVLCVLLTASVAAAPVFDQAAPVRDRAFWLSLATGGFVVPEGQRAADLLVEMIPLLASPDPVLRDEVAYSAAERWILREKRLSPAELRLLMDRWSKNLAAGLGETDTDRVFGRTFSALCLSLVAASDLSSPFLTTGELQALLDRTLDYFVRERDVRGYDLKRGWMHGVAHGADVLKFLARNPNLPRGVDVRLLTAVAARLDATDVVFRWGENERIALALHAAIRRADADPAALETWANRWVGEHNALWAGGPRIEPRQFVRVENAKQVMRSLFVAVSMDTGLPPTSSGAGKTLLTALGSMR